MVIVLDFDMLAYCQDKRRFEKRKTMGTTLKFRCTKIEVEEKTVARYQEPGTKEVRVSLYFRSPDLESEQGEYAAVTVYCTKERFEELGYQIGNVYELVVLVL